MNAITTTEVSLITDAELSAAFRAETARKNTAKWAAIDASQPQVDDAGGWMTISDFLWNNTRLDFYCDVEGDESDHEYVVKAVSFAGDKRDMSELFTAAQMCDFSAKVNCKFNS